LFGTETLLSASFCSIKLVDETLVEKLKTKDIKSGKRQVLRYHGFKIERIVLCQDVVVNELFFSINLTLFKQKPKR